MRHKTQHWESLASVGWTLRPNDVQNNPQKVFHDQEKKRYMAGVETVEYVFCGNCKATLESIP